MAKHAAPLGGRGQWAPRLIAGVIIAASALMAGCQDTGPIVPDLLLPSDGRAAGESAPTYRELVQRYNANLEGLDRLWARTEVDIRWVDESGERRAESGSGKLIILPPRGVAMTVGKLGRNGLWAGSNEQRYWMFDLRNDRVYFGDHANVGRPCARALPLPVRPTSVPQLLGMRKLDPDSAPSEPSVERLAGHWLIEPPGTGTRLLLDPQTARPVRIDLLNASGQSVLIARLNQYQPVQIAANGPTPTLASQVELYPVDREAKLTLELSAMSDGREAGGRINPRVIDFDTLMRIHKPEEVIDLDAACRPQNRSGSDS